MGNTEKIDEVEESEFEEILAEKRHSELKKGLSNLVLAIKEKEDKTLANAIVAQSLIFKKAMDEVIKSLPKGEDSQNLLSSFKLIADMTVSKIEASNNKLIEALENRLLPDTFDLIKNYGETKSVKVNYKMASEIYLPKSKYHA